MIEFNLLAHRAPSMACASDMRVVPEQTIIEPRSTGHFAISRYWADKQKLYGASLSMLVQ